MRNGMVCVVLAVLASGCEKSEPPAPPAPAMAPAKAPLPPVHELTGIDPARGDAEGGTYVRLTGRGFVTPPATLKVYFGSRQGTIVRVVSDTEVIAEAPGGKPGDAADVLVLFEGGGESKLPGAFSYAAKGSAAPVTIEAAGLPENCNRYRANIETLAHCDKLPAEARAAMKQAFDQAASAWQSLPPAGMQALDDACKQGNDAVRQAMSSTGCLQ